MGRDRDMGDDDAREREGGRARAAAISEASTRSTSSRADQVRDIGKAFDDAAKKMGVGAAALGAASMGVPPAPAGGGVKEALLAGALVLGAGAAGATVAADVANSTADSMDAADKSRIEAEKTKAENAQRERDKQVEKEIRDGGRDFNRDKAIDRARDIDRAERLSRTC